MADREQPRQHLPGPTGPKPRTGRLWAPAAALFGLGLILATSPPAAAALDSGLQQAIVTSNAQGLLVQRMTKAAGLIALGVQTEQARTELRDSRAAFEATIGRLWNSAPPAGDPDDNETLARLWRGFNAEVQRLEQAHSITPAQITPILVQGAALAAAIERRERRYVEAASASSLAQVLAKLNHAAGQQSILAERMAKDFIIRAYRGGAAAASEGPDDNRARFERVLQGLLDGAPELGLLPAPTEPLRRELREIGAAWRELKPLLADDGAAAPSRERIAELAARQRVLLQALLDLERLYGAL